MAKKKTATHKKPKVYEFTISLANTTPLVWRKVLAHEFIELPELHMLIQMSMGWEARHLYSFEINKKTYSDGESATEMNNLDDEGVLLSDALGNTKKFIYTYDFGDHWVHQVEINQELDHDPRMNYPICIGGENACPPEDCGGIGGFEQLKVTLAGKDSKEKNEMLTWLGGFYSPTTFDPNFVNKHFFWADELE
jgi:hypothetical protein